MKYEVLVTQTITLEVDESKFTEEFMQKFNKTIIPFNKLNDHIEHLAQLKARGIANNHDFIEGYGHPSDMGIKFHGPHSHVDHIEVVEDF